MSRPGPWGTASGNLGACRWNVDTARRRMEAARERLDRCEPLTPERIRALIDFSNATAEHEHWCDYMSFYEREVEREEAEATRAEANAGARPAPPDYVMVNDGRSGDDDEIPF